jgi:hypothetical protein
VTDGHEGLLAAVSDLFSATPRQRCLVHKQRNVLSAIPRRERDNIQAELVGIWEQPSKAEALTQLTAFQAKYRQRYPEAVRSLMEDEEHLLTFYAFPAAMHRHIQTTNAIESLAEQCASAHRSDRRLHDRDQLPHHRLGHDPGYSFAQNLVVSQLQTESDQGANNQPERVVQVGVIFAPQETGLPATQRSIVPFWQE